MDYCPSSTRFDPGATVTCTSFGRGHINTFDGLAYDFREFGDFYLVGGFNGDIYNGLTVQVRQGACSSAYTQSVPISATSSFSSTCNRAFAIYSGGNVFELTHSVTRNTLDVWIDGSLDSNPRVTYSAGFSTLSVHPVKYLNPYEPLWRDQQPYLADADFYAVYNNGGGIDIFMYFYSSGEATIQIVVQDGSVASSTGGLCGFADGCTANDLYILDAPPFVPSASQLQNAQPHISQVHDVPNAVTAGGLPTNARFISSLVDPGAWAPYLGQVWRVPRSQLLITSDPAENFNVRHYTSSYGGGGSCDSRWPSFLDSACGFDVANGNDPDHWQKISSAQVMLGYCTDFCSTSQFGYHNPQLQPYQCNGICQYPDDSQPIDDVFDENNLPVITTQPGDGTIISSPSFVFTPLLNLEGNYWFNLQTTDFCETRKINVSRTVVCNQPDMNVRTPATRYVQQTQDYGWPLVWLYADSSSAIDRVSWMFLEWPGWNDTFPTAPPNIMNGISFLPAFIPNEPGTHIVQIAMYNGCSIKKLNFTIFAQCASCAPAAQIGLFGVKEMIWGMQFNNVSQQPSYSGINQYMTKPIQSIEQGNLAPLWSSVNEMWEITNDNFTINDLQMIVPMGGSPAQFRVAQFVNSTARDFYLMYPNGQMMNETGWTTIGNITTTILPAQNPGTLTKLTGPLNTQYGVAPPAREYQITRDITRYPTRTDQTNMVGNTTNTTTVSYIVPCVLAINNPNSASAGIDATAQPIADPPTTFILGSRCVRDYYLNLTVGEPRCNLSSDVQTVEVDCGPNPEVYLSCVRSVSYVFATKTWPNVQIDGSQSRDPYNRTLSYDWSFASQPAGSTVTLGARYAGASTVNFFPDLPGTYVAQLGVSNRCSMSTDTTTINGICDTYALTAGFNAPNIDYLTTPPLTTQLNTTASTGSTAVGGNLTWTYAIVGTPQNPYPQLNPSVVPAPFLSNTLNPSPSITAFQRGAYTVNQKVTHGCNQFAEVNMTLNVNCNMQISPNFTLDGNAYTSTYTVNATFTTWPTVVLNAGSTVWTPSTLPPTSLTQQYAWYVGNNISVNTVGFNFQRFAAGVYNVAVYPNDGCMYAELATSIRVNCAGKLAQIVPITGPVLSGSVLTLNSSGSTALQAGITYLWTVDAPAYSNATIANPTIANPLFTPFAQGDYVVHLQVCDICSCTNASATFTVNCNYTLKAVASVHYPQAGLSMVQWRNNSFARVNLDGAQSDINGRQASTIFYTWEVFQAPYWSVYSPGPISSTTTTGPSFSSQNITLDPSTNLNVMKTWMSMTMTTFTYRIFLNNPVNNPSDAFPGCLYADINGTYMVRLTIQDQCQISQSTVTIDAECGGAPDPVVTVREAKGSGAWVTENTASTDEAPIYNITLARDRPRRLILDGSASTGYTTSKLEYYWSWADPDPRAYTPAAQNNIDEPYGAEAAISISAAGTYYLNFTVHDGCAVKSTIVTIYAGCSALALDVPTTLSATVQTGAGGATVAQTIFVQEKSQQQCAYTNTWTYYNFTGEQSAANTYGPSMALLLFTSILAFFH